MTLTENQAALLKLIMEGCDKLGVRACYPGIHAHASTLRALVKRGLLFQESNRFGITEAGRAALTR